MGPGAILSFQVWFLALLPLFEKQRRLELAEPEFPLRTILALINSWSIEIFATSRPN